MIDTNEMSYHIVGRHNLMQDVIPLRNQTFAAWQEVWEAVYHKSDSNYLLKSEEFERQDLVTCIKIRDKIAAIHLYSFHHLDSRSCRKTHYFDFFSDSYFETLERHRVKTAMSMEFLTVLPEFRKATVGFSLASTLIRLGAKVWEQADADAIIAPARNDVRVNELAYDIGFRCLEKETRQRGFTCDLIALFRGDHKPSADPLVNEAATTLWERKNLHPSAFSYLPAHTKPQSKKAA